MNELTIQSALKNFSALMLFKGLQESVIQNVLDKKDSFVIMPTGGGKSMCYQLPALMQEGTAIVVSPLIALMKNQVDAIRGVSSEDGIAHVLNSSLTKTETRRVKDDIVAGSDQTPLCSPESLSKKETVEFFQK